MAQPDFTIADVLAWARTKPADEAYNWMEPANCAIAQFGKATNRPHLVSVGRLSTVIADDNIYFPVVHSKTFGQLVAQLEVALRAEPVSDTWTKADAYMAETVPA
jgi:hypothetical protein